MEKMNSNIHNNSQDEPKKIKRIWTSEKDLAWEIESGDTRDFLANEDIPDSEYYKQYIPAVKAAFKELFKFEPRVTNSFIMDLNDFIERHIALKKNPKDEEVQLFAESSRNKIEQWIVKEYSHHYYQVSHGTENLKRTEKIIDAEVTDEKLDKVYAWIFQNIPMRPEKSE